jgi:UDP-N-acetylmuramate--alanine ligase
MLPRISGDAAVVVTSTASQARQPRSGCRAGNRVPVVRRAEMLAELMRLKSHGRGGGHPRQDHDHLDDRRLLDAGGVDPTVINGGIINSLRLQRPAGRERLDGGRGGRERRQRSCGSTAPSRWSPISIPNTSITMAASTREGRLRRIHRERALLWRAVLCIDHPEVQAIIPKVRDRRMVTYGFSAQADIRGENVSRSPAAIASMC